MIRWWMEKGVGGFRLDVIDRIAKEPDLKITEDGPGLHQMIRELNREHRGKDIETDVLSFPMGENGVYDIDPDTGAQVLGDIVISVEKAVSQAELYGHTLQREIGFLTVHSMLHLLGYDHEAGGLAAALMREKEEEVLDSLGLTRDVTYVVPRQ